MPDGCARQLLLLLPSMGQYQIQQQLLASTLALQIPSPHLLHPCCCCCAAAASTRCCCLNSICWLDTQSAILLQPCCVHNLHLQLTIVALFVVLLQ
jgi:hypothetical protein